MKRHVYETTTVWTGNLGEGTASYRAYSRNHEIRVNGKPVISSSSDPAFRGDPSRYNPEELLVASLSSCHMLWYLHLCADRKIRVVDYEDHASGWMEEAADGGGKFIDVLLRPTVTISNESDKELAHDLHAEAHRLCFIANSVRFPVRHEAEILVAGATAPPPSQAIARD
ncbi:MAG: OsmC family protein [Acidobacteriaceae bacterium]|nr:OsmC family protein [Acidobacteriaceae bacterium]